MDIILGYPIIRGERRKNRNSQSAYGAVFDNSIKVETTRSLATEFYELCSGDASARTDVYTLLGYQYGSRHKKGSKGYMRPLVAAHTDVGVITVLLYDSGKCATLQRVADACTADPTTKEWVNSIFLLDHTTSLMSQSLLSMLEIAFLS